MVLAAGLGTRLRPLTDERPKPLVPVGDRPLLHSLVEELLMNGAATVTVNAHYLSDEISNSLNYLGSKVHVIFEREIRGTAGGVFGARSYFPDQPLLVVNGDLVGRLPVAEMMDAPDPAPFVLGVAAPQSGSKGTVGIGAEGQVVRLRAAFQGDEVRAGDYIGVARLAPELVATLPEFGCLVGDVAIPKMLDGVRIGTVGLAGPYWDIGSLASYVEANSAWLARSGADAYRGEDAEVSPEVELGQAIVGDGAVVTGSGPLDRVIIWPGARATAPLTDAIVTRGGQVVRTERAHWWKGRGAT